MSQNIKKNGSAIVIVLGIVAVLMIMAVAFSIIMRTERAGTTNLRHSINARNGLHTAIEHAIYDIDNNVGEFVVPEDWFHGVMSSKGDGISHSIVSKDSDYSISILNDSARRHLNPTARALVRNSISDWRLLYGGVHLSNYPLDKNGKPQKNKPLYSDTVVGRIAYTAVNQTGYLDPNMVVTTNNAYCFPIETHQFTDTSYAFRNRKRVKFLNYNEDDIESHPFIELREKDISGGGASVGFTSFADLVSINESKMYESNGNPKPQPRMFINLFDPLNPDAEKQGEGGAKCLFLPDVFGPAAAFGMSPYPNQVKYVDYEDDEPLIESVPLNRFNVDGEEDEDYNIEEYFEKIHIAFKNIFSRANWIEKDTYGYDNDVRFENMNVFSAEENEFEEISWEFPGIVRGALNRSDLALLALADYYYYKRNGSYNDDYNDYIKKAIKDTMGNKINGILNAPCFKPVPMVSSIIAWTEKPNEDGKLYLKDSNNKFSEVGAEVTISPDSGNSRSDYYKKYELSAKIIVSFAHLYKETERVIVEGEINFIPNEDEDDIFSHINEKVETNALYVDSDSSNFEEKIKIEPTSIDKRESKIERDVSGNIVVYVQCPDDIGTTTGEDGAIIISSEDIEWKPEHVKFSTNDINDYSVNVEAEFDIKLGNDITVQSVPAPGYSRFPILFKLPLFRDEFNDRKSYHRVGYAMALDPRFAFATRCLHEYEGESALNDDFPYWVNNAMAERMDVFAKLKSFEKDTIEDPEDLIPGGRYLDMANPYAKLAMGYPAGDEEESSINESFYKGIIGEGVKPYPDTLHKIPGSGTYLGSEEYDDKVLQLDFSSTRTGIQNLGELGQLCIGPWETISLYRTQTPGGKYDFHTVFDYFTLDKPSTLVPGKVNLNAPPLLMTHQDFSRRVKLALEHNDKYNFPKKFDMGDDTITSREYVNKTKGINPEPLMAIIYGIGFTYSESWEIASRIISQNISYNKKDGKRNLEGICYFKDISQIGYSKNNDSLLGFLLDNEELFLDSNIIGDVYSDYKREMLLGEIAKYVTARGQIYTIVVRSDAFSPKYGNEKEGVTLASKVAVVEAWRDTEPVRDSEGNSLGYHNWHIRSVRIID